MSATTSRVTAKSRRYRSASIPGFRLVRESEVFRPDDAPSARAAIRIARDVYAIMAPFAAQETAESFWVLPLDSQHRLCVGGPIVITRGILNASLVHPREVFRAAIAANAAAIIVCHNHPSGDPTPSPDDKVVTDQLAAAGRMLDLPVLDHVVIGHGRHVSFAETGLM